MDRLLLKGVVVRKLNDELCTETSWENCSLTALPQDEACLLQVKLGKCVCTHITIDNYHAVFVKYSSIKDRTLSFYIYYHNQANKFKY